ncbi:MAG: serine O-acetyltransferase EpsC [Fimbriimonadaceae bacterium]|nr:serine O-acetyltransferase EpsC [Fimbriimonadaceae bacterium]
MNSPHRTAPSIRAHDALADSIVAARATHGITAEFVDRAESTLRQARALLFPHFSTAGDRPRAEVVAEINALRHGMQGLIADVRNASTAPRAAESIASDWIEALPGIMTALQEDAHAMDSGDPAAQSLDEVILAYPGLRAIATYRLAHALAAQSVPLLPRIWTEFAHRETGIDLHPNARIGRAFCIDHGTGIVVGATSVIGDHVRLYQGVTLGALAVHKQLASTRRHPTIEDRCVLYANATVLGGETVVGHDSIVGANAWVTRSVPPFSMVGRDAEVRPRRNPTDDGLEFYI